MLSAAFALLQWPCCFKLFALVRLEEQEIRLIFREKPNQTYFNVNERVVDPVRTEIFKRLNPIVSFWEGAHPGKLSFRDDEAVVANGFFYLITSTNHKAICAKKITTNKPLSRNVKNIIDIKNCVC